MDLAPPPSARLAFTEVAPRDGLQNLSQELSTAAKVELVERLLDCGPDRVEATSFVAATWVPQMADAEEVMAALVAERGAGVLARLRVLVPNPRGLERALATGARQVVANLGVTDSFNRHNLNRTVAETLDELASMRVTASAQGCRFDVSLSVAFGCPFEGRVDPARVLELANSCLELGADELGLADTIGVAGPQQVSSLLELLATSGVPLERVSLHLHDTRGLGLANALAGYQGGVRRFEGSLGGIGGCPFAPGATGNVCSEDLLYMFAGDGAEAGVDLAAMCRAALHLQELLHEPLPGRLHRAGIWSGEPAAAAPRVP